MSDRKKRIIMIILAIVSCGIIAAGGILGSLGYNIVSWIMIIAGFIPMLLLVLYIWNWHISQ